MKTENLAIILTDIVGYTEATSRLSRKEQKEMLNLHNQLLYPIIRNFGGRVVKTIGDALLLTFRSPTDAMLCSMAMQDALYDFNRKSMHNGEELHIRIAASLGEVRVSRNDVFGEAVNLTSRIESITPEDEIYLSEAIYLAMNKAEVPCVEVGHKQLKGISEPVRVWQIPRFTRARLVPEVVGDEDIGELSYPYGGAHLDFENKSNQGIDFRASKKPIVLSLIGLALVAGVAFSLTLPAGTLTSLFKSTDSPTVEEVKTKPAGEESAQKVAPPVQVAKAAPVAVKKVQKVEPAPVGTAVSEPAPSPHAELIAQLASGQGAQMRTAARRIARNKIDDDEVLAQIALGLEQNYQNRKADRTTSDALAWYCNVLGQAGNPDYLPILQQVSDSAANKKLRSYAAKNLKVLRKNMSR